MKNCQKQTEIIALSNPERKVMDWIIRFFDTKGHAPTQTEIATGCGYARGSIFKLIDVLRDKGYITGQRRTKRGIRLTAPWRVDADSNRTQSEKTEAAEQRAVYQKKAYLWGALVNEILLECPLLAPLEYVKFDRWDEQGIVLHAPTPFIASLLTEKMSLLQQRILQRIGKRVDIKIQVGHQETQNTCLQCPTTLAGRINFDLSSFDLSKWVYSSCAERTKLIVEQVEKQLLTTCKMR